MNLIMPPYKFLSPDTAASDEYEIRIGSYVQMVHAPPTAVAPRKMPPKRLVMACGNDIYASWRNEHAAWECGDVTGRWNCLVFPDEVPFATRALLIQRLHGP